MNKLWAPWRSNYIKLNNSQRKRKCIFCVLPTQKKDRSNFILKRNKHAFAILNIYPYNNGHVMVSPFRHCKDFAPLSAPERLDVIELTDQMQKVLKRAMKPQSFNIGINMGKVAGAGYGNHLPSVPPKLPMPTQTCKCVEM